MKGLRRKNGYLFQLKRLICLGLVTGMMLFGLPFSAGAAGGITKIAPTVGGPMGGPRGLDPLAYFEKTMKAFNADGTPATCSKWSANKSNPLSSNDVIADADCLRGTNRCYVKMGSGRGPGRVTFSCDDNPNLKHEMLVTGNGGKGPFEPTEIKSWLDQGPAPAAGGAGGGSASIAPPSSKLVGGGASAGGGASGGGGGGSNNMLLIGGAVGLGLAAAAAAAAAAGAGSSSGGCGAGKAPCNAAWGNACCNDLWYYAENGLCYNTFLSVPSGMSYVSCHN